MIPGPVQAAWLETAAVAAGRLDEDALAGIAIASQQAASHAHAAGLAAAAQITARAAAADRRIGLEADGRPVRLCRDAQGQISLALMLTGYSAAAWGDLGVSLTWRLPATLRGRPPSQGKSARRGRSAGPDRPAGRHQPRHHDHTPAPDHRRRAAGRHRGPRPGPRPRPGRPGRRGMRAHRPVTGLPATTPAAGTGHRPGRHLPQPGLPPARLARRPRPHPPLRPTRPHLRLQPRRHLPQPPPAQTTPPLDAPANHTRPLHLDHTRRTHLHHRTRHVCHLNTLRRQQPFGRRLRSP